VHGAHRGRTRFGILYIRRQRRSVCLFTNTYETVENGRVQTTKREIRSIQRCRAINTLRRVAETRFQTSYRNKRAVPRAIPGSGPVPNLPPSTYARRAEL